MRISKRMRAAFWSQVSKLGEWDCWEWKGTKTLQGTPKFTFRYNLGQTSTTARRFAFQDKVKRGTISRRRWITTTCRNANCVNPSHLIEMEPREVPRAAPVRHDLKPDAKKALRLLVANGFRISDASRVLGMPYDVARRIAAA